MRISLLCSDKQHPVNKYLRRWIEQNKLNHHIELVQNTAQLSGGDLLFLVSCTEIITTKLRNKYQAALVLHASDLPKGRGWSPHIWDLLSGSEELTVSLIEAEDSVDTGAIMAQRKVKIPMHALWDEINDALFEAEISLIDLAVKDFKSLLPLAQPSEGNASYYPKRLPEDSRVETDQSIASLFNKIRVCDPNRFPAFFELHGKKYKIILEKFDEQVHQN